MKLKSCVSVREGGASTCFAGQYCIVGAGWDPTKTWATNPGIFYLDFPFISSRAARRREWPKKRVRRHWESPQNSAASLGNCSCLVGMTQLLRQPRGGGSKSNAKSACSKRVMSLRWRRSEGVRLRLTLFFNVFGASQGSCMIPSRDANNAEASRDTLASRALRQGVRGVAKNVEKRSL
jgi:hypothetical protein